MFEAGGIKSAMPWDTGRWDKNKINGIYLLTVNETL